MEFFYWLAGIYLFIFGAWVLWDSYLTASYGPEYSFHEIDNTGVPTYDIHRGRFHSYKVAEDFALTYLGPCEIAMFYPDSHTIYIEKLPARLRVFERKTLS